MRSMGRSRGRARRRIDKAISPGAARGFARANMTAQPRTYGLAEAINAATNGGWGIGQMRDMMRDPRDDVAFGPSNPLAPAPIDPLRPDTKRPEPRLTEYPVAWNLPGNSDRLTPWSTLRAAAASVDIMRRCISIRKEQLQGLEWAIGLDDAAVQGIIAAGDGSQGRVDVEADLRRSLLPEIKRLTEFWCNPWKANGLSFEQWVNGIMEDHLVLDAVAIYPRMTYGGDVSAFELIDATTIKLLIDYRGARPTPPYPAFQQVLYGFPRGEFSSAARLETDEDGNVVELVEPGIPADQLWYFREEYRSFTPYGYSAVEQSLISARLYLKRQGWMLAEYDDGSTPLTWLVPDSSDGSMAEKLTFRTRRQWEDSLNDELAGQTRARHRMKVAPPGMNPVQMAGVDERYKPDYDMHLIKMLAGHFGVTSSGLGFSESRGLGNSGLHEGQADVQDASTTKPDTRMIERIVNELSRTYLKMPEELRFKFVSKDVEDQAAEDVARNSQRARGTITLNDDRKAIGKTPFTFPEADMPMVLVGNAWVPLEGMAERAEQQAAQEAALVESQLALTAAESAVDGEEVAEQDAEKALELSAYRRWARKRGGDARRPFICKALEPADWPGGDVPHDVDFAEWGWVPEALADTATDEMIMKFVGYDVYTGIEKAFGGNDNWRTLARDHRGRWVKRGSMRIAPLGPSTPDKPVLAGLARDAARRRQLPVSDASSTMGGMTTPKAPKLTDKQHYVLGTSRTSSAGYLIADRRTMPALQRAGLAEEVETAYGPQWVATPAGLAALERADADLQAELNAQSLAKLTPELRARVAAIEERAETPQQRQARMNEGIRAALSGDAPPPGSMAERIMNRQDQSVRDVVTSLQDAPGGWVAMTDVRAKLAAEHGMDRGQQDAAIRRLATTGDRALNMSPEDNQKTLTDADHAAAIDLGAGPQHIISLDPPRSTSADDPELTTVREGRPTLGFAIPTTPPAARAEAVAASTPDAPSAAPAGDTVRPVHIPDTVTGDERTRMEAFAAKNATSSAAAIREGRAELERDIINARGFIEAEGPGSVAGQRMAERLAQMERMAALPRGDAALESVKAARDLVAKAEAEGYVVRVGHFSASGGAPYFKVEAMNPATKNGFEATWHSGKGDGGKYGLDGVTLKGSKHGYGGKKSSLKGINEAIERDRPVMVDTEALAAELNARRNVDPSIKVPTIEVQQGDWRWNDAAKEWQQIGMIEDPKPYANRVIWGPDRETRLGTLSTGQTHIIARQAERPTLPPRGEGLKGLQRKPGEPSKRGDVLVIERTTDIRDAARTAVKHYEVYEVTSVTREGEPRKVRRFDSSTDMDVKHAFSHRLGHGKRSIIPGDRIDKEGLNADLAARVYPHSSTGFRKPHDDLRELGDVLYGRMKPTESTPTPAPTAPAAAPSVNDMMAQQMAASVASPSSFGGAHGKVTGDQITPGMRVQFRGTAWTVEEKPRKAAVNAQGKGGVLFRATREDQGITSTMRLDEGKTIALAAPKGEAAKPSNAKPAVGAAALAAAPKDVEATGARGIDRKGTAAIERYRGKSFTEINAKLRQGMEPDATVREIDRVMGESKLTSPVVVHRAVGDVNALFGDAANRKLDGAEWTDAAPQSTSTDADIADRFLASGGSTRTSARITMRVPAGVGAVQLSDERYEAELLLQRGLKMRVVSDSGPWRRGQKGPRRIEVEVTPA